MNQKKNYTLPIIMMIALFFMISFVTGIQNPLGVIVKNQFTGISNFMSQMGNFANFIAYLCMGIPSGMLIQRYGYKKTALLAVAVGFTGVTISFVSGQAASFPIYLLGAFISGFSMCMLNAVVNPMLNTLGGGGNKGNQLIQVGGSVNSVGATIAPILGGAIMGDVAKSTLKDATPIFFLAMAIFALTFIVLYFVSIPEPHGAGQKKAKTKEKHSPLSFRHFILGAIGIFVYVGIEVGIVNIANLYMTSSIKDGGMGMLASAAGIICGMYWLLMMVGRIVGASVGAKVSSKTMLATVSIMGIVFVLLAIFLPQETIAFPMINTENFTVEMTQAPINVVFLVLCGLCTSVMWGGIFNLAVEGLGKYTAAASGLFMTLVVGGGILPLVQAKVADLFGYLTSYWVIVIALAYLLFYALIGSKNVNKDIPVE
jgi:FHS family L-fucose permease-like MFS transporter